MGTLRDSLGRCRCHLLLGHGSRSLRLVQGVIDSIHGSLTFVNEVSACILLGIRIFFFDEGGGGSSFLATFTLFTRCDVQPEMDILELGTKTPCIVNVHF